MDKKQLLTVDEVSIAIVVSRFNEHVTNKLYAGAMGRLKALNIDEKDIDTYWVPGAAEIPLTAQRLAAQDYYDAVITLGAVIKGDTLHHLYVNDLVSQGCQQVALDYDLPVIFGILTTENEEQAMERAGGHHGNRGVDAVDAALAMVVLFDEIDERFADELLLEDE